jgi:hypothetical protein
MKEFIIVQEDGYLSLEGRVLLIGDLVEISIDSDEPPSLIGQIERVEDEFQISIFNSDLGRLLISQSGNPIKARRLADRPTFLPSVNDDWQRKPRPKTKIEKNSSGNFVERILDTTSDGEIIPSVTARVKPIMDKLANEVYFWDIKVTCPHCRDFHHHTYPGSGTPTSGEVLDYFESHCDGPGYFIIVDEVLP